MLLSGMSPASGENVDYLVSNLNKKILMLIDHILVPQETTPRKVVRKNVILFYIRSLC